MFFKKKLKKFLSYLDIDFNKYKDIVIQPKNGKSYKLGDITEAQLKTFDWAYELAKHNEMLVISNDEDLPEILKKLYALKGGIFKGCFRFPNNVEVLERCKDTYSLIDELYSCVWLPNYSKLTEYELYYIENNDINTYILGVVKHKFWKLTIDKTRKAFENEADNVGLKVFNTKEFPQICVEYLGLNKGVYKDIITYDKNHINSTRSDDKIKMLKQKKLNLLLEKMPKELIEDLKSGYFFDYVFSMPLAKTCLESLKKLYKNKETEWFKNDVSNLDNLKIIPKLFPSEIEKENGIIYFADDEFGHGQFGLRNNTIVYDENNYIGRVQLLAKSYDEFKQCLLKRENFVDMYDYEYLVKHDEVPSVFKIYPSLVPLKKECEKLEKRVCIAKDKCVYFAKMQGAEVESFWDFKDDQKRAQILENIPSLKTYLNDVDKKEKEYQNFFYEKYIKNIYELLNKNGINNLNISENDKPKLQNLLLKPFGELTDSDKKRISSIVVNI